MTILQLQLNSKHGFVLTKPECANPVDVKLMEGEVTFQDNKLMLGDSELATVTNRNLRLNTAILKTAVGDVRRIVQQLRYFSQTLRA